MDKSMIDQLTDILMQSDAYVVCAKLAYDSDEWEEKVIMRVNLRMGYKTAEYRAFLYAIDQALEHNESNGKSLDITIWLSDGSWILLDETWDDQRLYWAYKSRPAIPKELRLT